ncbi:MAG: hypothetical protein KJ737_07665 [Proteobacteria bacterium]|nr:hypothetical protein [Pseudomonadota bacterium]
MVTDVTTVSFSVIWASSEASTANLEVYHDEAGTSPVAGTVITAHPVDSGDAAIRTAAEDNGVMKVRVTGLEPNTTYYFRTVTTSKSASVITYFPDVSPFISVTTESQTVRSMVSGSDEIPFSNDVIIKDCFLEDGSTPAEGTLLVATVDGGDYPMTTFVGDGIDPPSALIDLNNMFSRTDNINIDLTQGKNLTLVNFRGMLGNSIVYHDIPQDNSLTEVKTPSSGLNVGSNFVSFQLYPTDTQTEEVISLVYDEFDSVWAYQAAEARWIFWDKTSPPFLKKLKELHPFTGYWGMMNADASWLVNGDFSQAPIPLFTGPNLIGFRSIETIDVLKAIDPIYDQLISIWTIDHSTGNWIFWDKTSPSFLKKLKVVIPGKAYWVLVSENCQL